MHKGFVLFGVFILFLGSVMIVYSFPIETLTRTGYVYPYRFFGAFVLPVGFVIAVIGYNLPEYEHPPKEFFFTSFILIFTFSWIALLSLFGRSGRPFLVFFASLWYALFFSAVATLVCTTIYGLYNMMKKRKKSP